MKTTVKEFMLYLTLTLVILVLIALLTIITGMIQNDPKLLIFSAIIAVAAVVLFIIREHKLIKIEADKVRDIMQRDQQTQAAHDNMIAKGKGLNNLL